jgi:phenylacetate-CoA ligase
MFIDPAQIAAILKRHPNIGRARLLVTREADLDAMRLQVEGEKHAIDVVRLAQDFHATTGLRLGGSDIVPLGSLPNDGRVIEDQRRYD